MKILFYCSAILLLASCGNDPKHNSGPIVLGDPATIVTETDSAYLTNFVTDISLREPIPEASEETAPDTAAKTETVTPVAATPSTTTTTIQPAATSAAGLTVAFPEVTIFIPGISVKAFQKIDLSRAAGASYQITSGKLPGNQLKITGLTIQKISQRYKTVVIAKNELGTLELQDLSRTTDWKPVKGAGNMYRIDGLDKPEYNNASAAQVRNAVNKAARNKRMSRANLRKWENSVRNIRSVTQAPLSVKLRSVIWKIEGKDAKGKYFSKELRIDLPV